MEKLSKQNLKMVAGGENLPPEHFGLHYCPFCSTLYPIGEKHQCSFKVCPYCGEIFASCSLYDIHLDMVHGVEQ